MKTSEHLIRAKSLIRTPELWCKYRGKEYTNGPTKRCARQAIMEAGPASPIWDGSAMQVLSEYLRENTRYMNVSQFNDYPTTTHEHVMRVFDEAIKIAQKMEARSLSLA